MGQNNQKLHMYVCAQQFSSQAGEKEHEGSNTLGTLREILLKNFHYISNPDNPSVFEDILSWLRFKFLPIFPSPSPLIMDDNIIVLLTKHKQCTMFPCTPPRLPYILALFKYYHSFLLNFAKTIMFCLRDCQSVCRWADNLIAWLLSPPLFQLSYLQSFCLSRLCQTLLLFSALLFACFPGSLCFLFTILLLSV